MRRVEHGGVGAGTGRRQQLQSTREVPLQEVARPIENRGAAHHDAAVGLQRPGGGLPADEVGRGVRRSTRTGCRDPRRRPQADSSTGATLSSATLLSAMWTAMPIRMSRSRQTAYTIGPRTMIRLSASHGFHRW